MRSWSNGVAFVAVFLAVLVPAAGNQTIEQGTQKWPNTILIIRHAEKPSDELQSPELAPEGKERAKALARLFEASTDRPKPFPEPDFIFAARNTKQSHRPLDTVSVLAKTINVPVNSSYSNGAYSQLARELLHNPKYAGKTILICWHHGTIPQLAQQLNATGIPDSWKGSVYDRVWQISYDNEGKGSFHKLPQRLLAHDKAK